MIRKYKSGTLTLSVKKEIKEEYYDKYNMDEFYFTECFNEKIIFTFIQGLPYFVDTEKGLVYESDFDSIYSFIDYMLREKFIRLIPCNKEENQQLYNEYLDNGLDIMI